MLDDFSLRTAFAFITVITTIVSTIAQQRRVDTEPIGTTKLAC